MADRRGLPAAGMAGAMALALAACSGNGPAAAPEGEAVACAVGGAADLAEDCVVEKVRAEGATNLVIHHPDGAFRRFIVLPGETGLIAADGADSAVVTAQDGAFAVTVGQDRYIVPRALLQPDAQ